MKKLFLIKDSLANQISYYYLMLLLVSLPFDIFYSHIILVGLIIHTAIQFNKAPIKQIVASKILLLQSVFFVTLISTIYTSNKPQAYTEWLKQLTIFALPLVFCFNGLDIKRYRNQLLEVFSIVCTLTIIYLYYDAIRTIRYYKLAYTTMFSPAFTNHNFSDPIGIHATFFAMQIAMAIIYLITRLIKPSVSYKPLYFVCVIILSTGLVQLSSKSVFAVVLFIAIIVIPRILLHKIKLFKYVAIVLTFSFLFIALIFTSNTLSERFFTDLKYDLALSKKLPDSEPRLVRWQVAMELIVQAPIIGHGAGTEVALLHEKFYVKRYYSSFINHLNSHNQYLSFLIKAGIIGLLVYVVTLWYGFKEAWKKKDFLFLSFMILVATVSIAENLFDVDKGIFFYAVFFSFFVFSNTTELLNDLPEILITKGNQVLV